MPRQPELFPNADGELHRLQKHVGAVALIPASRRITTLARKCYNVMLHLAQEQGTSGEQEVFTAPLNQVMVLANYDNSHNYALVKQTLKQLVSTIVEWQSPSSGEVERWDACGLLASVAIEKHKSGALLLEWSYAASVRAQLLNPERYARISLEIVAQFRSHAAIVLYEICSRYIDNPSGLTARQPWMWWRPVLSGNPEIIKRSKSQKAPEYRNFKRDVLKPAIAEINAIGDIEVEGPIEHKGPDNKTVVDVQFRVRRKPRPEKEGSEGQVNTPLPVDLAVISRAMDAGVKQSDAEEMLDTFGEAAFVAGLLDLENRKQMPADKVGAVASPGRWLRSILPAKVAPAIPGGPAISTAAPNKRQAKWLDEWLRRRREQLRKEFLSLPDEIQKRYKDAHRATLAEKRSPLLRRYDSDGWEHQMLVAEFLKRYALATVGANWDRPSAEQLLAIASELGDA